MDPSIARQGIKESEKVYQLFQQLLTAVGKFYLFDGSVV